MNNYIVRKIVSSRNNKYKYKFYDKKNKEIKNKVIINDALKDIYIPPAYDNLKINLCKKSKVLAIGYDNKSRPQYIYNKRFKEKQSIKKYNHMYDFGLKFKKINKSINDDLYSFNDSKEKQIAIILKLIMDCNFRVGNEKYKKENKSFGVTTLQKKHIKIKKDNIIIDFNGKKNVRNTCKVNNKRIIRTLKQKKKSLKDSDSLFTYRVGSKYYKIKSSEVNDYLKQFGDFTAKNFRTWGANIEFIKSIVKHSKSLSECNEKNVKKIINESIKDVSEKLHNTTGVCKSNYLDPELIRYYEETPTKFFSHFNDSNLTNKYIDFLESLI